MVSMVTLMLRVVVVSMVTLMTCVTVLFFFFSTELVTSAPAAVSTVWMLMRR